MYGFGLQTGMTLSNANLRCQKLGSGTGLVYRRSLAWAWLRIDYYSYEPDTAVALSKRVPHRKQGKVRIHACRACSYKVLTSNGIYC